MRHSNDFWINIRRISDAGAAWRCDDDCGLPDCVASASTGWIINGSEFVPYDEAMLSPTARYGFAEDRTGYAAACSDHRLTLNVA